MSATQTDAAPSARVELAIGGMTCASCAVRVEKKLNRMDGVTASVNFATEKAVVTAPAHLDPRDLVAEVEKTGYTAALPAPPEPPQAMDHHGSRGEHDHDLGDAELEALRRRLIGSVVLAVPVILLSMIPALQFEYWQWASLALAAPVVVWGAWPFHRAAWINLRHGAATMDTLISLGVSAAFLWSLYALFFGHAGMPGMTHEFEWVVQPSDGAGNIYLEVAAGVTMFVLAGRYVEVRSKRRAGAALRALMEIGAKDVAVRRPGTDGVLVETRVPIGASARSSWCGRARRSRQTASSSREPRPSTPRWSRVNRCPSTSSRATRSSAPPSARRARSSYARPASEPTPSSPRWRDSSTRRSRARPPLSAWPTASRASSCRSCWSSPS
jgi:copper chaperone CopZ